MPSYRVLTAIVLFMLLTAAVALAHPALFSPNTTFLVTTTDDTNDGLCDAHCSLRETITAANANPGYDVITFSSSVQGYILLSGTQLPIITDDLAIGPSVGGYSPALTIDAANNSRIFEIADGAALGLYRLELINGSNDQGGAITNAGTLTLMYSEVSHSLATLSPDSKGGAIYNQGALTLETSTIGTGNESISGGGIYNEGDLTVSRSVLYNNTADFGAAIYNTGVLTVTNTTVSTNEAANAGGGLYNTGTLTLTNATIFSNHATTGNGLVNFTGGTLYAYNTVIATLYDPTSDCTNLGLIAANVNNLVEDGSCSPSLTGDPQLTPLQPLGYHQPLPGSPLLDAGDNAACPPTDQREGMNRPADGDGDTIPVCDIGAIEIPTIQPGPITPSTAR